MGSDLQETEWTWIDAMDQENKAIGRRLDAADDGDLQGDFDA